MSLRTVAVAGAFDPIHLGHVNNIRMARALGDYLVVILNSDEDVIRKRGYVFQPIGVRYELLKSLREVDRIVLCIDNDGTVANTLRWVKPDVFAKGGDRNASTMPVNEIQACKDIGCEIVYGVGDVLGSSTDYLRRIREYKQELFHKPSGDFK